jgi:hypothetical protein
MMEFISIQSLIRTHIRTQSNNERCVMKTVCDPSSWRETCSRYRIINKYKYSNIAVCMWSSLRPQPYHTVIHNRIDRIRIKLYAYRTRSRSKRMSTDTLGKGLRPAPALICLKQVNTGNSSSNNLVKQIICKTKC